MLLLLSSAYAANLPTECPDIVTGSEVAALRADVVAPAVISVTSLLHDLRTTHADAACPAEDGAACVAGTGVSYEGTLVTGDTASSYDCPVTSGIDRTLRSDAAASALVARGLDGADVVFDGDATHTVGNACGEGHTTDDDWTGGLAVTGAWGALRDDAVDGRASTGTFTSTGWPDRVWHRWYGTSGACTWWAETEISETADARVVSGLVRVDGVEVTYAWAARYTCDPDCAWRLYRSATWVDGVATGDAGWALHADIDPTWVDADGDGWAAPNDCDDADAALYPELAADFIHYECGEADADGDGHEAPVDCDDADPSVGPGFVEVCGDEVDQDCNGSDAPCAEPEAAGSPEAPPASGCGGAAAALLLPLFGRRWALTRASG